MNLYCMIQVEVNKMDGCLYSFCIFCEKLFGVFIKLMQVLNVFGFIIVYVNIIFYYGLIFNDFNVEVIVIFLDLRLCIK